MKENYAKYPKFAATSLMVLRASASSSSIERLFSEFSNQLTAKKNRLTSERMLQMAVMKRADQFGKAINDAEKYA